MRSHPVGQVSQPHQLGWVTGAGAGAGAVTGATAFLSYKTRSTADPDEKQSDVWLAGPAPRKRLDRSRLEERIRNLLSSQNMCVLATVGPDGPLATPVRYYHLDFAVIFPTSAGSPKMRNIAADRRVSIGVFAPLVGQASSRGAQLFGYAAVLTTDHPQYGHYWSAFRWQCDHVERSRSLDHPPTDPLVVVETDRIVYTEHWLRRDGYAPRQFWIRPQHPDRG